MTTCFRVADGDRASIWEWAQTTLLAANLIWTTLCLGGYRPETMLVTLALSGSLLMVHFAACAVETRTLRATDWAGWCAIPFLAYALINVVMVTPVAWLGWMDWLGWANMIVVFWVTLNGIRSSQPRRTLFLILVLLAIMAVLLGCYQRFVRPGWLMLGRHQLEQFMDRASGSFGIPNSLAGFLLLLLPATGALALRRHARPTERVWWGWVTLVFGFGLLLTMSRGGWIALALALVVWPLSARRWTWNRRAVSALVVLAVSIGAGAVLYQVAPKVRDRFDQMVRDSGELSRPILWRAAWRIFRENPMVGSGAGSYNVRFEQHRPERFLDEPQWAHNDYLNTLSDYGAIGFLLLIGAGGVVVLRQRGFDRPSGGMRRDWLDSKRVREALAIGVLAFAIQCALDFHFKIPALAMAFAVVAAFALGRRTHVPAALPSSRLGLTRVGWLLAIAVVAIAMLPMSRFYRAEALRYRARQAMDSYTVNRTEDLPALLRHAEDDLRRATSLAPGHAGAWADLAYAFELRAFADPAQVAALSEPAVSAAHRATELSSEVPEFWIRLGVALDMQARRGEAEKAFDTSLRLAPRNSQAWYYYAYHLSFDTERREAALRAIATSLSLDPGNGAAEALRVKLNERS